VTPTLYWLFEARQPDRAWLRELMGKGREGANTATVPVDTSPAHSIS